MYRKFMDVSPKVESPMEEPQKTPRFRKLRAIGQACCPRTFWGWAVFLISVLIAWQLLVSIGLFPSLTFPLVDNAKWQAVFLTNGQVYFGHLKELNKDYVGLNRIYYLRVSQNLQPPESESQPNINLVKLGDELHGPEDTMFIPKSQILFWENLKATSEVTLAIESVERAL